MKVSFYPSRPSISDARQAMRDALVPTPFRMLPPGSVRCPEGWLGEQLRLVAGGITGRLPEYGPYFRPEKNGFLFPDTPRGWEEIPYWLRGFYPLAVLLGNESLLKTAHGYIEAIFRSVRENGWFGPAYLENAQKTASGEPIPDLFPNMLLTDTLILYHSHTKDPRVLPLLKKYFGFCLALPDDRFLPRADLGKLRWQRIRGGDMLNQIYWYYDETGDASVLPLAERVHAKIAKNFSGFIATHAVDFAHRFAYDAVFSRQSGDRRDFERSEAEYRKFADLFGQMPRGIFAADEQIRQGATDPREAYEPCGMVELCKNFYLLGRLSGDVKYADRVEDVILNHFPASFTPLYQQIHYLTSPNSPILSNDTYAATYNGSFSHDRSYQIMTPNNRCCGHNAGMGWPFYVMNLWQGTADGGAAAFLYAPCEVEAEQNGQKIALSVKTGYPFKDTVEIVLRAPGTFPMYLRVPSWCEEAILTVGGKTQTFGGGGWLKIEKTWSADERVLLRLPMTIRFTEWKKNGSVSVDRGPLTYSVKIAEEYRVPEDALAYNHPEPHLFENYEILPRSPWNYGLLLSADGRPDVSLQSEADVPADQPFTEENAPVVLRAKARRIPEWRLQDSCAAELQKGPFYTSTPDEWIEMIPLGCARLRISCLPTLTDDVSAKRWRPVPAHIPCEERPPKYEAPYDMDVPGEPAQGPWKPADEK